MYLIPAAFSCPLQMKCLFACFRKQTVPSDNESSGSAESLSQEEESDSSSFKSPAPKSKSLPPPKK